MLWMFIYDFRQKNKTKRKQKQKQNKNKQASWLVICTSLRSVRLFQKLAVSTHLDIYVFIEYCLI